MTTPGGGPDGGEALLLAASDALFDDVAALGRASVLVGRLSEALRGPLGQPAGEGG